MDAINTIKSSHGHVRNIFEVIDTVRHETGMNLTLKRVRHIMKVDLGLKYKRLKKVNPRANCSSAMIQR